MSASLYHKLKDYTEENIYPFHMPGHKRNRCISMDSGQLNIAMDITEITGFDNLHDAQGVIDEAQKKYAALCGADETFFLVNGSTCGMEAAILSVLKQGETAIVARNCHRSVYSGLVLAGVTPVYLKPEVSKKFGFCLGISIKEIQQAIAEHPEAKAVILTSPTYEGMISDIKTIAEIVHQHYMILIVDEAHGAHLGLSKVFPASAIQLGADLVVQSVHKTLPAPTQTALLHVKGNRVSSKRIRNALDLLQTSSPSYLFLAAIDWCRELMQKEGENLFDKYMKLLIEYRQRFLKLKNICLVTEDFLDKNSVFQMDVGKLVFFLPYDNFSGKEAGDFLRETCGIELEMYGLHHMIAMTTCADTREGFERLYDGLMQMDKALGQKRKVWMTEEIEYPVPQMMMLPRDTFFTESKEVLMKNSEGYVSCDFLIPYPPGIPVIVPGEQITSEIIDYLFSLKKAGVSIVGLEHDMVRVCKEKG